MKSTGLVLAAGGIAAANEVLFTPAAGKDNTGTAFLARVNWRIVPATLILALVLGGLEKASRPLAVGFAGLTLGAVLIVPTGAAGSPLTNVSRTLGYK